MTNEKGIVENYKKSFVHPCYTSILLSISSQEEKLVFLKHIFSIAIQEGKKSEIKEITELLEDSLLKNYGIRERICPYRIEDLLTEFFYYNKYAISSSCVSYFRSFKKDYNTCYACQRSPFYANKYRDAELLILRRMVNSAEECTEVIEKIFAADIQFLSVYEVIIDHKTKDSLFLPLNQFIFDIYRKHGPALFFVSKESSTKKDQLLFDYFFDKIIDYFPQKKDSGNNQIRIIFTDMLKLINNGNPATPADMTSFCEYYKEWQVARGKNIMKAADENNPKNSTTSIPKYKVNIPRYEEPS